MHSKLRESCCHHDIQPPDRRNMRRCGQPDMTPATRMCRKEHGAAAGRRRLEHTVQACLAVTALQALMTQRHTTLKCRRSSLAKQRMEEYLMSPQKRCAPTAQHMEAQSRADCHSRMAMAAALRAAACTGHTWRVCTPWQQAAKPQNRLAPPPNGAGCESGGGGLSNAAKPWTPFSAGCAACAPGAPNSSDPACRAAGWPCARDTFRP